MQAFLHENESPLAGLSFEDTAVAFSHRSDADLQRGRLLFRSIGSRFLTRVGPSLVSRALSWGLPVRPLIRRYFFDQFCGGYTIEEALQTGTRLYAYGVQVTLDYAVEAQKSPEGYERCKKEVMRAIDEAKNQDEVAFVAIKLTGLGNIHALSAAQRGELTVMNREEFDAMALRLDEICKYAAAREQPVMIDAEESWIQGMIDTLAEDMMLKYNTQLPIVYTTIQMYRHDRLAYLKHVSQKFAEKQRILAVKLVRGAYLEKENAKPEEMGYATPMQPTKAATDADFDAACIYILENLAHIAICAGTHNESSCLLIAREMERLGIPHDHTHVNFSQLYGMSDNITFNLAKSGYRVTKYLPYGPLEETMPYLFRRAEENTSIAGQSGRELGLIERELERRKLNQLKRTKARSFAKPKRMA